MKTRNWVLATAAAVLIATAPATVLADTHIERELALESGGKFVLDTDTGGVEITGSSSSGARVEINASRDDFESRFDVSFEEHAGEVVVKVKRKGQLTGWFSNSGKVQFTIEVPERTTVDIDTAGGAIRAENLTGPARLDTSGGSIHAAGIRGDVLADTSGGSITVEDVEGNVNADTSGGSISIANVRGNVLADTSGGGITVESVTGDVEADTSGGSIKILEAGGRVVADTSGGPIHVSLTPGNSAGGSLSTSGGGITVELDPGVGLDIDASSSGGSVTFDLPLTVQGSISKQSVRGSLGSGGETLKLRSSGGGIKIRPL